LAESKILCLSKPVKKNITFEKFQEMIFVLIDDFAHLAYSLNRFSSIIVNVILEPHRSVVNFEAMNQAINPPFISHALRKLL